MQSNIVRIAVMLSLAAWLPALATEDVRQMTLEAALATAESTHPAIKEAEARIAAAAGREVQASLRPNPSLAFQSENWRAWGDPGFRAGTDLDLFVYGSQPFEVGGKRKQRMELARREVSLADLELQVLKWAIRQEVRTAYLRSLLAQKEVELMRENGRYFEEIVEYHRIRVEQGAIAEADLIRVRLERQRLALLEQSAAVEAEKYRIGLLRKMGMSDTDSDFRLQDISPVVSGDLTQALDRLLAGACKRHPKVLYSQALVDRARALAELERSQAKPDWTVSFGYKRTAGFNTILGGVTIPIALFNRNEGNILYSERDILRAEYGLQNTVAEHSGEIATAQAAAKRRQQMLRGMESGIVQDSEESLRIALGAYQAGGFDLLRLLDSQRVRNEVQLLYVRTQMEYIISVAELEGAPGEESLLKY